MHRSGTSSGALGLHHKHNAAIRLGARLVALSAFQTWRASPKPIERSDTPEIPDCVRYDDMFSARRCESCLLYPGEPVGSAKPSTVTSAPPLH